MFDLTGRIALVTGAGQGVGRGIATTLAAQGAKIAVNDLFDERASDAVDEIHESGGTAVAAAFDVSDYAAVEAGVAAAEAALGGPVDILVNNAGVPPGMGVGQFRETKPEDWRKQIDLNTYGVMNCSRAVINGMCDRGHGRIVTISSGAGTTGIPLGVSAYGAGKGGGIAFMRHLAMENARDGVTCNTVALGLIDNHTDPEVTAHMVKTVPVGFLGTPEDISHTIKYIIENGFLNATVVEPSGGLSF